MKECVLPGAYTDIIFAVNTVVFKNEEIKHFRSAMQDFVDKIDISPDVANVGILSYSDEIFVILSLGGYPDSSYIKEKIEHVQNQIDKQTHPHIRNDNVLSAAREQFLENIAPRPKNQTRMLFVFDKEFTRSGSFHLFIKDFVPVTVFEIHEISPNF